MNTIRAFALMLAVSAGMTLTGGSTAVAREYAWCLHYPDYMGGMSCAFDTYEQCMASSSGIGGHCFRNFDYRPEQRLQRRHRRRD